MRGRLWWKKRFSCLGLLVSDPVGKRLEGKHDRLFRELLSEAADERGDYSPRSQSTRLKSLDALEKLIAKNNAQKLRRLEAFAIPTIIVVVASVVAMLVYQRATLTDVEVAARTRSFTFRTTRRALAFDAFPVESITFSGRLDEQDEAGNRCERIEIRKPAGDQYLLFDAIELPAGAQMELALVSPSDALLRVQAASPGDVSLSATYPAGSTISGCKDTTASTAGQLDVGVERAKLTVVLHGITSSSFQSLQTSIPVDRILFHREYEWPPGTIKRLSTLQDGNVYFEKLAEPPLTLREGQLLLVRPEAQSDLEAVKVENETFRIRFRGRVSALDLQVADELRSAMPSLLSSYTGRRDLALIYSGTVAAVALLLSARRVLMARS